MTPNFLQTIIRHVSISLLVTVSLHAAPPTKEDDKAIAGSWKVNPPNQSRIYEISEGRSIKITGGYQKDKRDRLIPQDDGSYHVYLESGVLRLNLNKEQDRLTVEWFGNKDDIKNGVSSVWKAPGIRHEK
jgi:hypothetical protein